MPCRFIIIPKPFTLSRSTSKRVVPVFRSFIRQFVLSVSINGTDKSIDPLFLEGGR